MNKLLYVLHGLGVGGTELVVANLAKSLSDKYQIGIIALDHKGTIWEEISKNQEINLYCVNRQSGWSLKNFSSFFQIIKDYQPDLIHAHQYSPFFFTAISKLLGKTKAKLIFTEHGRHYPDLVSLKRRLANKLLATTLSSVTAVCEFSAKAIKDKEGLNHKVNIIYNGIEIPNNLMELNLEQELGLKQDSVLFGYIGSFRAVKNPVLLLKAFLSLAKKHHNIYLVYIGDGVQRTELENLVKNDQSKDRVFLLGEKRPVVDYLKCFDVFVQPSMSEANSLALLEAQALGITSIVTNVGGAAEVVNHQYNGLLVESQNQNDLENAMQELVANQNLRLKFSENAKKTYQNKFRLEQMVENYDKLYQQVLS